jgi:hypothetical protein
MSANYQGTAITEPPSMTGRFGRAWRLNLLPVGHRPTADHDGTVAGWIVHSPGSHPFWSFYLISVVHLRPIDGVKPATITRPGSTHEVVFLALNPEQPLPPSLTVDKDFAPQFLTPVDLVHQFAVQNDAVADEILTLIVSEIIQGGTMPDQDNRTRWAFLIDSTVDHYNRGTHKVIQQ